jgi:hypothetical protein
MPIPGSRFSGAFAGLLLLGGLLLLQTGCSPVRETSPPGPATETGARPPVSLEAPTGYTRYRVVTGESEVRVLVYRDGPMARLGHNHVIRSLDLTGDILIGDQADEPRFSLVLPVASFSVDDTALRLEEGADFPGAVDEEAISGTRSNMLSEALLDGTRYHEIRIVSRKVTGTAPDYIVTVAVEVKGQMHDLQVPVRVERTAQELRATGAFTVTHEQLGLTPFTVMGGLLSVKDEIKLRFRIVARPRHTDSP